MLIEKSVRDYNFFMSPKTISIYVFYELEFSWLIELN